MQKAIWYIKQILPLKYKSTFTRDGQRIHSTWRMWFGRCFAVVETVVHP